jgi:predicted  nucleic acid-binding Zn-ribbon protein
LAKIVARMQLRQSIGAAKQRLKTDQSELNYLMKQVRNLKNKIKLEKKRIKLESEELERYMNELTSDK